MTVKELKKLLENVDDNRIVILQKDGEGNGYSPLECIDDESNYRADSTWSGEVGYQKLTPELIKQGYSDEDILSGDGAVPALILVPVN
jgi:hypothetical protein